MQDQDQELNQPANGEPAEAAPEQAAAGTPGIEEQLSATEAKLAEMHDAFMRAKAEGENIRRRAQEDVSKAHKFAIESFAEAMVPVRDSLEMALKVDVPSVESLKEGVEMTLKQLTSAFEKEPPGGNHAGAGRQAGPEQASGRGRRAGGTGSQHSGHRVAKRLHDRGPLATPGHRHRCTSEVVLENKNDVRLI